MRFGILFLVGFCRGLLIQNAPVAPIPPQCSKDARSRYSAEIQSALSAMKSMDLSERSPTDVLNSFGIGRTHPSYDATYFGLRKRLRGIIVSGYVLGLMMRMNKELATVDGTEIDYSRFRDEMQRTGLNKDPFKADNICYLYIWYHEVINPNIGKHVAEIGLTRVDTVRVSTSERVILLLPPRDTVRNILDLHISSLQGPVSKKATTEILHEVSIEDSGIATWDPLHIDYNMMSDQIMDLGAPLTEISHSVFEFNDMIMNAPALPLGEIPTTSICEAEMREVFVVMKSVDISDQAVTHWVNLAGINRDHALRDCVVKAINLRLPAIYVSERGLHTLIDINHEYIDRGFDFDTFKAELMKREFRDEVLPVVKPAQLYMWYITVFNANNGKSIQELGLRLVSGRLDQRPVWVPSEDAVAQILDYEAARLAPSPIVRTKRRREKASPEEED